MHTGPPAGAAELKLEMEQSMDSIHMFFIIFWASFRVKSVLPWRGGGNAAIFPTELSTGCSMQRINTVRLRRGLC